MLTVISCHRHGSFVKHSDYIKHRVQCEYSPIFSILDYISYTLVGSLVLYWNPLFFILEKLSLKIYSEKLTVDVVYLLPPKAQTNCKICNKSCTGDNVRNILIDCQYQILFEVEPSFLSFCSLF